MLFSCGRMELLKTLILVFLPQTCMLGAQICVQDYEFRTYEKLKNIFDAKTTCRSYGGNLAKIDSVAIKNAVSGIMGSSSYYIGLKLNVCKYRWHDGTSAPNSGESDGYSYWDSGHGTGIPGCVIANGSNQAKWMGENCNNLHYFICQKRIYPSVNIYPSSNVIIPPGSDSEIRCYAPIASTCLTPDVTWYNGTNAISTTSTKFYQDKYNTSLQVNSKLVFKNANLSHAGSYSCKVKIGSYSSRSILIAVSVPVPPTIDDVTTSNCDSSVNVSWTPNSEAIALYHMLKIFPISDTSMAKEIRFEAAANYKATLDDLLPSTTYIVQVSACEASPCSHKHTTRKNIITGGIPQPVTSPKLTSNGQNCNVYWKPPVTIRAEITSYLITVTTSYHESRSKILSVTQNYTVTNESYTFAMQPNTKHEILIQAVTCAGPGKAIEASGACIGSPIAPNKVERPTLNQGVTDTDIIIRIPNEEKGLISCIFVVISDGKSTNSSLEEYIHGTLKIPNNTSLFDQNILQAIPYNRIAGNQSLTLPLGDGSTSSCNMFETGFNKAKNVDRKNLVVIAKNKKMAFETSSRVYVIAAVPYKHKVFLKSSDDAKIRITVEATTVVTERTLTETTYVPTTTEATQNIFSYMIDIRYFAGAAIVIPMLIIAWKLGSCSGAKKSNISKKVDAETPPENIYDQVAMSEPNLDTRQPDSVPQTSRAVDNSYSTTEISSGYVNLPKTDATQTQNSQQQQQTSQATALYDLPPLAGYTTMRSLYANASQLATSRCGDDHRA